MADSGVGKGTCRLEIARTSAQFLKIYLLAGIQESRRALCPKFLRHECKSAHGISIRQLDILEWRRR